MTQKTNPYDEEFLNPNTNFNTLMMELRNRIENIRLDTIHINDPELKGVAEKLYTELRLEYFKLMRDDLELQKLYESDIENDEKYEQ